METIGAQEELEKELVLPQLAVVPPGEFKGLWGLSMLIWVARVYLLRCLSVNRPTVDNAVCNTGNMSDFFNCL
jgi:hypothetical protein